MIRPVDGIPMFTGPNRAERILASLDARASHVAHPSTIEGVCATAAEIRDVSFPRAEVAAALVEYNTAIGAPAAAVENARRLASDDALVVTTGQQPCAALGPLYVLYKAVTAIKLARDAEERLGVPVVPVFWNASEDHDIDEVAVAAAPLRGGSVFKFRADLEPWRGRPISDIGPDGAWQRSVRELLETVAPPGDAADAVSPRPDESWARYFARGTAWLLGAHGLVMLEPHVLRTLAVPIATRVIGDYERVQQLLQESCDERVGEPAETSFCALDGPPLFLIRDGRRRRVHASGDRFTLRGVDGDMSADELLQLIAEEPHTLSSHASLRPVVQNTLLPVVAAVLGPGEIAYHEELLRLHASPLGASRRMPVLWPRSSLTILDERAQSTMTRFGIEPLDLYAPAAELADRFTPSGDLAESVRALVGRTSEALDELKGAVLALDATLERPMKKTADTVARSLSTLAEKVERAEAAARGFAPDKLEELSSFVRPEGKPQERTYSVAWAVPTFGAALVDELVSSLDIHDRRHKILQPDTERENP